MIMSHYTDLEMSLSKHAIIPKFERGYYSEKGHYHNEPKGVQKNTGNSQCYKQTDHSSRSSQHIGPLPQTDNKDSGKGKAGWQNSHIA